MSAFDELSTAAKKAILQRLRLRKARYQSVLNLKRVKAKVLIVGDRPGPGAPTDPTYHHTPFYAINNCSGWLNRLLEDNGIQERDLVWLNAYDTSGRPFDSSLDYVKFNAVIALGGNAEKWCRLYGYPCLKVSHPQFHKRFKNKKPYELIDVLKTCLR